MDRSSCPASCACLCWDWDIALNTHSGASTGALLWVTNPSKVSPKPHPGLSVRMGSRRWLLCVPRGAPHAGDSSQPLPSCRGCVGLVLWQGGSGGLWGAQ